MPMRRRGNPRLPPFLKWVGPVDIVVVVVCVYVVWWNLGVANSDLQMSRDAKSIGTALRLDQQWGMFAPYPIKDDGWFVIPAKLANGKDVDLFNNGEPVSYDKPAYVAKTYKDSRWRIYMMNLWSITHQDKRLFYGRHLCREWNWYGMGKENSQYMLKSFRIVFMREITLPDYRIKGPDPVTIWEHQC